MKKRTAAVSIAATTAALLLLAAPLAASAHVEVTPGRAAPGSETDLTFQVPDESASAGTVKVVVELPTTTPFTAVATRPVPGWSAVVDTEKLAEPVTTDGQTITEAPVRITWTAEPGTQIAPGQFQEFTIATEAVPDTGRILFPTHQTYSDGSVVDWTEQTPASGKEPEHPAPTLYVKDQPPAESGSAAASGDTTPTATASGSAASAGASGPGSDPLAIALGLGGLALGAVALVVAVVALTRGREKVSG